MLSTTNLRCASKRRECVRCCKSCIHLSFLKRTDLLCPRAADGPSELTSLAHRMIILQRFAPRVRYTPKVSLNSKFYTRYQKSVCVVLSRGITVHSTHLQPFFLMSYLHIRI